MNYGELILSYKETILRDTWVAHDVGPVLEWIEGLDLNEVKFYFYNIHY